MSANTATTGRSIRLEGLDGLRGLAMLGVIFCHLKVLHIGWTGLSSFFVLSGFLITRILLKDLEQSDGLGSYFKRYYIRRTLRVFPVYYAYLIALTIGSFALPALAKLRDELPAAFLYLYNFQLLVSEDRSRMLSHLWSLSVEEQFYLIWPWLIALVPKRYIPALCIGLIASGPLIRETLVGVLLPGLGVDSQLTAIFTYGITLSHLDAFAFGALINFLSWRPRAWQLVTVLAVALALGIAVNGASGRDWVTLGWPLFMPSGHQYAWGYTLVNFFWFMVICAIIGGGPAQRFFSMPLLDYLGKRSYSTYIIHFPVLGLMSAWWQSLLQAHGMALGTLIFVVPYLTVVFSLSAMSYRFVEMPFNNLRERFQVRRPESAGRATATA